MEGGGDNSDADGRDDGDDVRKIVPNFKCQL